jgi:hypothetical protein
MAYRQILDSKRVVGMVERSPAELAGDFSVASSSRTDWGYPSGHAYLLVFAWVGAGEGLTCGFWADFEENSSPAAQRIDSKVDLSVTIYLTECRGRINL